MIFVTVGTQLPFDRMVRTIDAWAGQTGRGGEVFAQTGPSPFKPRHIQWAPFIPADDCRQRTCHARVIIAHAGMGTIITALELGKPILVMPRRAALGEQRNDHQLATAQHFLEQGSVAVAFDEAELRQRLERLDELTSTQRIAPTASPRLLRALQRFAGREVPADVQDHRDERAFAHFDYVPLAGPRRLVVGDPSFATADAPIAPAAAASPGGS